MALTWCFEKTMVFCSLCMHQPFCRPPRCVAWGAGLDSSRSLKGGAPATEEV